MYKHVKYIYSLIITYMNVIVLIFRFKAFLNIIKYGLLALDQHLNKSICFKVLFILISGLKNVLNNRRNGFLHEKFCFTNVL